MWDHNPLLEVNKIKETAECEGLVVAQDLQLLKINIVKTVSEPGKL